MGYWGKIEAADAALEQVDETILPSLSMMLDALLDAAALARPGADAEVYAAELRKMGRELQSLSHEVEAMAPAPVQLQRPSRPA